MEQVQLPGVSLEVSVPNPQPALIINSQIPETYRCKNCQRDLLEEDIQKHPLDFMKKNDGTLELSMQRFSAFCKHCNGFIKIVDPLAHQQLYTMFHKS